MKFLLIFFITVSALFCQNETKLKVFKGKESADVSTYQRQGSVYANLKELGAFLSPLSKYNLETERYVITSGTSKLEFISKNPFVSFITSDGKRKIFQLPTSTYVLHGDIYIPLKYSLPVLNILFTNNLELKPNGLYVKEDKVKVSKLFNIYDFSIDEKANGTLIRLNCNKKIPSYNSSYQDGALTITLAGVSANTDKLKKLSGKGVVKEITTKNLENSTELKIRVSKEYSASEVLKVDSGNDILITIHNKIFSQHVVNKNKDKWDFDVIVIDAGHGGQDAGAIGVNGVKEKDVNLAVALKLGKLIEQNMPGVKVIYTRKNDTFVELYKRGKIANEYQGKLFISIHCNSTPVKPTDANGFEVYLLRPGRTQEAIHIAERENSVIQYEDNPTRYQKLTDENFILVSMAHSSYMKYSEKFSELLDKNMSLNSDVNCRGVKQAGFYVLVGASMPSVLIETGFLSNRKDADYLKHDKGQQQIASSILNSIKNYKEYYEQFIEKE